MTEEQIRTAEERCDAATDGPWFNAPDGTTSEDEPLMAEVCVYDDDGETGYVQVLCEASGLGEAAVAHNWAFITHARTDLPLAIDALRAERKKSWELADELRRAYVQISELEAKP